VFILFDDEEFTYHQLANTMPQHHYGNSKTMDVLTGDLEALTELDLLEHDPNEDTYHIGNGGKNAINQNDPRFSARAYQKIGDDLKETHDY
jgi:hypothetical protein